MDNCGTTIDIPQGRATAAGKVSGRERQRIVKALLIRRTEERLLKLFADGQLHGTVHTCIGQEFVGVAVAEALRKGDYLFSNHRGHGHYLAWTDDVEGLVAELMGSPAGVCGGRGGSQHLCRDGFFSNGVQGGIVPVAAGLAMANKRVGIPANRNIAAVFVGDGTWGEGAVYETLNIASKWSLPLLVVVEDNGIAQSTDTEQTLAGTIEGRAAAFDIEYVQGDTWDVDKLLDETRTAVDHVRQHSRPVVLHVRTYRLRSHSKGDDTRDPKQVAEFAQIDPLTQIIAQHDPTLGRSLDDIDERLDRAVSAAAEARFVPARSDGDTASTHSATDRTDSADWEHVDFEPVRIVDSIREGLAERMEADDRVVLLGEDIRDPYGGAFKVTRGLSTRFPDRVFNTPISEAAIVGMANGLALAGFRPVAEIMFGDFLLLAADQIVNHAAKFSDMYNGQVRMPLVIRTPMGGYRGYGPTHSQSLEKHLFGIPGTRMLALNHRWPPCELYRRCFALDDGPVIIIENKLLYGRQAQAAGFEGFKTTATADAFPTMRIRPTKADPDLTLVCYGGMLELAEQAAATLLKTEEIAVEILAPTQLYPLDLCPLMESIQQTRRLLVVEEGQGFSGFGSEVIASATERLQGISLQCARVCAVPSIIPAGKPSESKSLPSVEDITSSALQLILQ